MASTRSLALGLSVGLLLLLVPFGPVAATIDAPSCEQENAAQQNCGASITVGEGDDGSGGGDGEGADDGESGEAEGSGGAGGTGASGNGCVPFAVRNGTRLEVICMPLYSSGGSGGAPTMTPVQAVQSAVAQLQLHAIRIGMAPEVDPELGHRHSYVRVPVWMWVHEPDEETWGPVSAEASVGGHRISLSASVDHVAWDMGDGTIVRCGEGTVFHTGYGFVESPTCGHLYEWTSRREPGGLYTVTATSHWRVQWTASTGQSGIIEVTTASETQLEIGELRAVNVSNPPNPPSPPDD